MLHLRNFVWYWCLIWGELYKRYWNIHRHFSPLEICMIFKSIILFILTLSSIKSDATDGIMHKKYLLSYRMTSVLSPTPHASMHQQLKCISKQKIQGVTDFIWMWKLHHKAQNPCKPSISDFQGFYAPVYFYHIKGYVFESSLVSKLRKVAFQGMAELKINVILLKVWKNSISY